MEAIATIGHNNPPSRFDEMVETINAWYDEAKGYLDGEPLSREEQAANVATIMKSVQAVAKEAEAARKAEKEPHMEAAKAVDATYRPLLDKAEQAVAACKAAILVWQKAKDAAAKAEQAKLREEAEKKAREAREAFLAADPANLTARAEAETKAQEAKKADIAARVAANTKATTHGAVGRGVGLRTSYHPILVDAQAAARHYWTLNPAAFETLLIQLAEADFRSGKRDIPGFDVETRQTVV